MRKKLPEMFDTRTITKFLFFPKTINNELRWLETATWVEAYIEKYTTRGWLRWWKPQYWFIE